MILRSSRSGPWPLRDSKPSLCTLEKKEIDFVVTLDRKPILSGTLSTASREKCGG